MQLALPQLAHELQQLGVGVDLRIVTETQTTRRAQRLTVALSVGMLTAAALLYVLIDDARLRSGDAFATGPPLIAPVIVAALVVVAELCVIHIFLRRETHTFSLREVPFVIGLFVLAPGALVCAYVIGAAAVLIGRARQSGLKLLFNVSLLVFEVTVGIAAFLAVAGNGDLQSPRTWAAAVVAALVLDTLGGMLVTLVIAIHGGGGDARAVGWLMLTGSLAAVTNACFALISLMVLSYSTAAAVLLTCLGATLFAAYRAYASLRRRYSHLVLLRRYTAAVGSAIAFEDVAAAAVRNAAELLEGDHAELWFRASDTDEHAVHAVLRGGEVTVDLHRSLADAGTLWFRMATDDPNLLVTRSMKDPAASALREEYGCDDYVAAALRNDTGLAGFILVGNRIGDVATFEADDRRLLETLADYAGVALDNGRLVNELQLEAASRQHEALHDALTGLPNRRGFVEHVRASIGAGGGRPQFAVLLVDLDHFKDVNDTFGHPSGDDLLVEVAHRLRQVTRAPDGVARLGGDEFAVVLANVATADEAQFAAERLHASVARPYDVNGVTIQVDASIGIALCPEHGTDIDTLLRCADIAMYVAKEHRSSCRVYAPTSDHHSPERLALATELKAAIENNAIALGYQPTKDVESGSIVGVEALARWEHPTRGVLPPPVYIAVAEQTGLIRQLTRYVLSTALAQRQEWARRGIDLRVSVNISVHDLESPDFVAEATRLVRDTGTPPDRLTLEITETQAMERPERITGVLDTLRASGIAIAIDDFGTGYSSLTSLRSLPLDEIKIDRSFIRDMAISEHDDAIVRSMIELARRLQLRIVAEGVETDETEQQLRRLGCHVVQGYFLSRALAPADLERWLAARPEQSTLALVHTTG